MHEKNIYKKLNLRDRSDMVWDNAKRRLNQCFRRIFGIARNNFSQLRNIGESNSKRNIEGVNDEGDHGSNSEANIGVKENEQLLNFYFHKAE
jgi:hypothetical protein